MGTDNKNNRLQELKDQLIKGKHSEKIIDYSFTKLFQPRKHEINNKNVITSLKLTILIINFLSTNIKVALKTSSKLPKITGLFLCNICVYHETAYIIIFV